MVSNPERLVLFDIDGTLLSEQSQFLLLKYLRKKQIIGFAYFIRLYFWFGLYKIGIVTDPAKVFYYAVRFLADKTEAEAKDVIEDFIQAEMKNHFFEDMLTLLKKHKSDGERVLLLSNAMDILVRSIASHLDVKEYIGTGLEVTSQGIFTGKLVSGITYGSEKVLKLESYLGVNRDMVSHATCYTDHHSDIPLLEVIAKPVVVHPTKKLERVAKERGWKIIRPS